MYLDCPPRQVFVGNIDNESTKTNLFEPPIVAQYIRVIPVVCRKACSLRMELVGCELNGEWGGGTIPNDAISFSNQGLVPPCSRDGLNMIVQRTVCCNF